MHINYINNTSTNILLTQGARKIAGMKDAERKQILADSK